MSAVIYIYMYLYCALGVKQKNNHYITLVLPFWPKYITVESHDESMNPFERVKVKKVLCMLCARPFLLTAQQLIQVIVGIMRCELALFIHICTSQYDIARLK
jgi:hypothetical protein